MEYGNYFIFFNNKILHTIYIKYFFNLYSLTQYLKPRNLIIVFSQFIFRMIVINLYLSMFEDITLDRGIKYIHILLIKFYKNDIMIKIYDLLYWLIIIDKDSHNNWEYVRNIIFKQDKDLSLAENAAP